MAAEVTKPNFNFQWASGGAIVAPSDIKIQTGWTAEVPPFQWENFLQNRQDNAILHLFQKGVSVWSATDNYYFTTNGECSYVQGSNGHIYVAVQDSLNQNPVADVSETYWADVFKPGVAVFSVAGVSSWTVPAILKLGLKKPTVYCIGGGGGGGGAGATAAGQLSAGGGGAAGGYSQRLVDLAGVTSVSVTVGAAGAAGVGGVSNGGAGGTSSFGAFLSSTGGSGGINLAAGTTATYAQGGAPAGLGSSGDLNGRGAAGHASLRLTGNDGHSGAGGDSFFSGGGVPIYAQSVGSAGILGSGGSGSLSINGGAATNGGAGGVGVIVVVW